MPAAVFSKYTTIREDRRHADLVTLADVIRQAYAAGLNQTSPSEIGRFAAGLGITMDSGKICRLIKLGGLREVWHMLGGSKGWGPMPIAVRHKWTLRPPA